MLLKVFPSDWEHFLGLKFNILNIISSIFINTLRFKFKWENNMQNSGHVGIVKEILVPFASLSSLIANEN